MRIAAVITFLLCAAAPASAKHFWANAAHLAGRTGKNMVTFHDKQAATEEWVNLLGPIADGIISEHALKVLGPNGAESASFLYGTHPSTFRYQIILAPEGFFDAMVTQDFHEAYDGAGGRHGKHWLTLTPTAVTLPWSIYGISATESAIRRACRAATLYCH